MKNTEPICPYFDPDKKEWSRPGCWILHSGCKYREDKTGGKGSKK